MLDIMKRIDQGEYSITQDDFDAKTNQLTSCLFLIYAALTRRGILIIIIYFQLTTTTTRITIITVWCINEEKDTQALDEQKRPQRRCVDWNLVAVGYARSVICIATSLASHCLQ